VDSTAAAAPAGTDRLRELAARKVWFLDRDGTLTLSDRMLAHVDAFLSRLRAAGRRLFVLTNNSSKSPRRHWENFRRMGLDLAEDEVLVSIQPALAHLRERGLLGLHLVANAEVTEFVRSRGFEPAAPDPQAVLLTYDTEITYAKLVALVGHLRRGVPFYATHVDVVCPTPDGPVPDIGTTLRTIEMTLGARPLATFGKPSHGFVEPALRALGLTFADAVVVGDRLYTDLALAEGTEMLSVLVLTGETTREAHDRGSVRADVVVPDLGALVPWIG
jgi:HAD superfamily hydrolase (TIGR01450 family)